MTELPRQSDTDDLDWVRARQVFTAFLRHRLPAIPSDALEDLVQEALVRLLHMSRRESIRNLEAVANTISDSVVSNHFRAQKRRHAFLQRLARHLDGLVDPGTLGDPMDRVHFIVIAYFRKVQAPCAELAEHYFSKIEWRTLAERQGRSHADIRQRWSRCTERLRRATRGLDGLMKWWFDE